jgi:HAD superfamily hydrolase (TIGR01490 family)
VNKDTIELSPPSSNTIINEKRMKKVAFFDFDGTLTRKDSFGEFIKFAFRKRKIQLVGLIIKSMPIIFFWKTGLITNSKAKEKLFSIFFNRLSIEQFSKLCLDFSKFIIPVIIRKDAFNKMQTHLLNNDTVCIVSASITDYIQPWASNYGVAVIGTEISKSNKMITGDFSSPNCIGKEKVNRINQHYALSNFEEIHAYGDSAGDKEMLDLATHPNYRVFKD